MPRPTIPASSLEDHNYTTSFETIADGPGIDLDDDEVEEYDSPLLQSSGEFWKIESGASQPISESQSSFSSHSQGSQQNSKIGISASSLIMVDWSSLLPLFHKCGKHGCSRTVADNNIVSTTDGAAVSVKYTCDLGHTNVWSSSETFQHKKRRVAKINITLAGYLFLCGLQFKVFKELCDRMGLLIFSSSTYYRHLRNVVYPTTYNFWMEHQAANLTKIMEKQSETGGVRMSGDARFDSPGYSAMYGTYYTQDLDTKMVLGVYVAMKHQC